MEEPPVHAQLLEGQDEFLAFQHTHRNRALVLSGVMFFLLCCLGLAAYLSYQANKEQKEREMFARLKREETERQAQSKRELDAWRKQQAKEKSARLKKMKRRNQLEKQNILTWSKLSAYDKKSICIYYVDLQWNSSFKGIPYENTLRACLRCVEKGELGKHPEFSTIREMAQRCTARKSRLR